MSISLCGPGNLLVRQLAGALFGNNPVSPYLSLSLCVCVCVCVCVAVAVCVYIRDAHLMSYRLCAFVYEVLKQRTNLYVTHTHTRSCRHNAKPPSLSAVALVLLLEHDKPASVRARVYLCASLYIHLHACTLARLHTQTHTHTRLLFLRVCVRACVCVRICVHAPVAALPQAPPSPPLPRSSHKHAHLQPACRHRRTHNTGRMCSQGVVCSQAEPIHQASSTWLCVCVCVCVTRLPG